MEDEEEEEEEEDHLSQNYCITSVAQLLLGAAKFHHNNCLGVTFGRRNSHKGFECDFYIVISGDVGLWSN